MQFKKTLVRLLLILFPFTSSAQTTFYPQGDKTNILLERLEIKAGKDSILNFSKTKPWSRKYAYNGVQHFMQQFGNKSLSKTDLYNLRSFYMNNLEYVPVAEHSQYLSKKSIAKRFYKTPATLYEVHVKDFDLAINPVIQYALSKENNNDQKLFLSTRGLTVRGRIANKIGFNMYITDNQERDPLYVQQWVTDHIAVPGAGLYKAFKGTGYDYFDARGYFTFNVTKYIDVAFGYDKQFIGNGYRSLFMSDFSNNILFLKLNTRIWRFNYQNLFMELHPTESILQNRLLPKKYAVMHHLDVNVTKRLNIGLFEGVMFGRKDRFEFGYLNPVIFYRSIELQNGSYDNSVAGADFKLNLKKHFQVYGQFLLDDINIAELRKGSGWWANKWGIQLGGKYIDAFGISNLDLQLELNRVRPFVYSHYDSTANYSHYNQPLAHPLGANFQEFIAIARYQPAPRWTGVVKVIAWKQGLDLPGDSYGANIFLPNNAPYRIRDYGYKTGDGRQSKGLYLSLLASYELRENIFIDLSLVKRKLDITTAPIVTTDATIISGGFRINIGRREFEF
ncbi:MAG: capsule assembly Wzi family protein [Chitinophagaceae bacterium]